MKKRLVLIYTLFAIIPLIIMDIAAFYSIYDADKKAQRHEMENVANAVKYYFTGGIDDAANLADSVYTNKYVNDYLNTEFKSELDYYEKYKAFFDDTLIDLVDEKGAYQYFFFVDNDTITNGAQFQKLSKAEGESWYKYIEESGAKRGVFFDYTGKVLLSQIPERRIYFFQRMDYFNHDSQNLILIEINYGALARELYNTQHDRIAYVCDDKRVIISNGSDSSAGKPFTDRSTLGKAGYQESVEVYNQNLDVLVMSENRSISGLAKKWWMHILGFVLVNILFPAFLFSMINRVTYEYRIREQENILTRQHAELLALHSQINPHFLFNALESIRMHSIIKNEKETAEMVEKLAKLQRQYTEWSEDNVLLGKELEFVDTYLGLQKYRFGDRLSYSIEASEESKEYRIPKLTLVTFVENACVHGIESKNSNGWIFIRVQEKDEDLVIEVEDTGSGMDEEESKKLLDSMRNASIEMLKEKGRVGIINACLRLKMVTEGEVTFDLESEPGVGTIVTIKTPVRCLKGLV